MLPADGYTDLPAGKIANVVTCLEMRSRPALRAESTVAHFGLRRVDNPDLNWYRELFRAVGGPYLWFSRLTLNDAELRAEIHHADVAIYAVEIDGSDEGILELNFRRSCECELVFFGLSGKTQGRGIGRALLERAIELAWSRPITRFWVKTCTLDHPAALPLYMRAGFVPFKRQIEIAQDPRLTGLLSPSAAPDVPLL